MKHTTLVPYSLFLIPFLLAGCDYAEKRATEGERSDRLYQAAMGDYAAGRLDKSIEGFEKVLRANPGNASARFQLACLLQDHRKDPLGAIRNYREYEALFPDGDKVKIAEERAAACERLLAAMLVKKYDLGGIASQDEAIARLKVENAKLTTELEATKKALEGAKNDLAALRRENDRVRRMVLAQSEEDDVAPTATPVAETESIKVPPAIPTEKELTADDDTDIVDRVKFSADVDQLMIEEKNETGKAPPFGKTVRKPETPPAPAETGTPHEKRPETYVVQDGDTLFKLAIRFYGQRSAWTRIRDANKATVSTDGRIRAGQTLKLP